MSKKTINGMHKSELLTLIKGIAAKLNKIDQALEKTDLIDEFYEQIKVKKQEINDLHDVIFDQDGQQSKINSFLESAEEINKAYDEIFNTEEENGESGSLENIQNAQIEVEEKLGGLQNFYKKTFEDTDEVSIQNKLDGFVSEFQEHSNEFTKLHYDIFGYIEINDDGKEVKHTGELSRTKKVFEKYQEKYDELFNQIEGLLSGATTTSLSKNFDDKVKEYKEEREKWETRIFLFLIGFFLVSVVFAFVIVFKDNIEKSAIYTLGMPIYTFGIWFMIFMGNRRAESRKLEESFKHKFVMAKSFVGYKKSITEMTDADNELMNIHMNNLLNAISKDSSKFFEIKGESHPIADFFKKAKGSENRVDKT